MDACYNLHMSADYGEAELPPERITENGRTWEREKFDQDSYQWMRPLEDDEYDWDSVEDDVSLLGTDVPIRVVTVQYTDGEWTVQGAETAGPNYHRPGFTEVISSDYVVTFDAAEKAFEAIRSFIKELS